MSDKKCLYICFQQFEYIDACKQGISIQFVSNAEVRRTSGQPLLTSTIQARHLSLCFGTLHDWMMTVLMILILTALPPEEVALRSHGWRQVLNDIEFHNINWLNCQYGSKSPVLEVAGCEWHYALIVVQAREMMMMKQGWINETIEGTIWGTF